MDEFIGLTISLHRAETLIECLNGKEQFRTEIEYAKIGVVNGKKANIKDEHGKTQYIVVDKKLIDNMWTIGMLTSGNEYSGYPTQNL